MSRDIDYLKKYLKVADLEKGISLLEKGVAPQYIVGNVDFYGYIFKIDERVLIPRFETELLVEKAIDYVQKVFDKRVNVLDIGTGSGCIAITLKKKLDCVVDGVDISNDALEVAKLNAYCNNVDVNFYISDIFSNVDGEYDVLISNPPYISYDEEIEDIVLNNEPTIALFADNDGLYFYEEILKNALRYLKKKFFIAFEIGYTQGECVRNLAYKYLGDVDVFIEKDYSNRDRFVFILSKD